MWCCAGSHRNQGIYQPFCPTGVSFRILGGICIYLEGFRAHFYGQARVGQGVVIPIRMGWRTAFGGDHHVVFGLVRA